MSSQLDRIKRWHESWLPTGRKHKITYHRGWIADCSCGQYMTFSKLKKNVEKAYRLHRQDGQNWTAKW